MGFWDEVFGVLFTPAPEPFDELRHGYRALLRGHIAPRDLLSSPLGGIPCVYYHSTILEWRSSGVLEGFWQVVERDEAICEFYLEDDGHRVLVSPFRARVAPPPGGAIEHPHAVGPFRRALEFVLRPGDELNVHGVVEVVHDVHDEERAYREPTRRFMVRAGKDQDLLVQPVANESLPLSERDVPGKSFLEKFHPRAHRGREMAPARNDDVEPARRRGGAR